MSSPGESIFSSFTFRIMLVMLIIAVVPVVTAFVIFTRISEFNQDLQQEAVKSIEGVTDIYRSLVKADASRIDILKHNLTLEFSNLMYRHQIQRLRYIEENELFKADLQQMFDEQVSANDLLVEIMLVRNMNVVVKASQPPVNPEEYHFQTVPLPLFMQSYANMSGLPLGEESEEPDAEEMPMLIAEPVDDAMPVAEEIPADFPPSLPETITADDLPSLSRRGFQLIARFAIPTSDSETYDQLGTSRFLHESISAMEKGQGDSVTTIYQTVFITIAVFVIVFAIICAWLIAYSMSRKISALTKATRRIADGDLDVTLDVRGNDQLSYLTTQFNAMVKDIRLAQESRAYIARMQAWQEVARRLAHEIKNPLTPIVLAVQQLDGKFDDYIDRPQKYRKLLTNAVEIVTEETETLRKLVKNFSEFARMPIPEKKETVLASFVAQVVEQNPQFAEQAKRITVHPADPAIVETTAEIDHELMRRVIVNIIRNGIEAARNAHFEPEIDVSLVPAPEGDEKHRFCLHIIDNGPGLTDEQKSKLFMPYFTTKSDGTGLGLSIVRKIVEDHNGRISLHDRDDGERGTQADIIL